jgi:hypothetical protein
MAETTLITITDVRTYRHVDPKFDTVRFAAFCQEVQRKNLRNLLGEALYKAFMDSDRLTGIYKDLLDGKVYTFEGNQITYYGIKPALCYWWLAVATREGELFLGTVGAIQFVNNQQQSFESAKQKEAIAAGYIETAQGYANDVIKFLNENSSSYPLWEGDSEEINKSNFISFRL